MRSIALAFVLSVSSALPALGESTEQSLERARVRLEQLRRQTAATTQRYEDALRELARIDGQITRARSGIAGLGGKADTLTRLVQQRAVEAYVEAGGVAPGVRGAAGVLDAARATVLLENANQTDTATVDALEQVLEDVKSMRDDLERAREAQKTVAGRLESEQTTLESQLQETARLERRLEVRLSQEQLAARLAREAARRAVRERAASAPAATQEQGTAGATADAPQGAAPISSPGGGVLGVELCPIQGAVSFVDTWHAPRPGGRLHLGVDMMTNYGTPNVAVTSGTVRQEVGDLMGNAVFLYGDNGNTYYYFHLSRYGASGRVSAGTVVGYAGNSGNASGGVMHTHFEVHPGGGAAVNPTPPVAAAC